MGQKTNPIGFRLKINRSWYSNWYSSNQYGDQLIEDIKIRELIKKRIFHKKSYLRLEISDIYIKRFPNSVDIYVYASRPGLLIGKKGVDIENLKKDIRKNIIKNSTTNINVNINEIKKLDLDANVLAQVVGKMIEGRRAYKKAMKQAITRAITAGAKGVKVVVAGRLGGSDMARRECFKQGSIPLHTLDAIVSYSKYDAITTYGIMGVSVWVFSEKKSKKISRQEYVSSNKQMIQLVDSK